MFPCSRASLMGCRANWKRLVCINRNKWVECRRRGRIDRSLRFSSRSMIAAQPGMSGTVSAERSSTEGSDVSQFSRLPKVVGKEDDILDVVIVGAGLAGLAAARTLLTLGRERFIILEGRNRVGGRTLDVPTPSGAMVEMGGQWVGPDHTEIISLAKSLDLPLFNTYEEGQSVYHKNGRNKLYVDTIPCGLLSKIDLFLATKALNRLARPVPSSKPWTAKDAVKLDQQSVGAWIEVNLRTREGKTLLGLAIQAVYGEGGELISLLDLLSSITGAGGDINEILGDAQSMRFVHGPQSLSNAMAKDLDKGALHFNEHVRAVRSVEDGLVRVTTEDNTYLCRRIILTMPRVLVTRVHFEPLLPANAMQLLQHQPMGSVIKINVVYAKPFWRERGLSGVVVCSDVDSPIQITYDNSPDSGAEGVIVTFMSGRYARDNFEQSPAMRRQKVLEKLVEFFGTEAADPIGYEDKVWAADDMALGAYGSFNPPGVLTAFRETTLCTRYGRIHFAGDGVGDAWQGYMEGALRSGRRAAQEASALL